jgi:hypothetical protein
MKDRQLSGRYLCLPIRCSGLLVSLHNEDSIYVNTKLDKDWFRYSKSGGWGIFTDTEKVWKSHKSILFFQNHESRLKGKL